MVKMLKIEIGNEALTDRQTKTQKLFLNRLDNIITHFFLKELEY